MENIIAEHLPGDSNGRRSFALIFGIGNFMVSSRVAIAFSYTSLLLGEEVFKRKKPLYREETPKRKRIKYEESLMKREEETMAFMNVKYDVAAMPYEIMLTFLRKDGIKKSLTFDIGRGELIKEHNFFGYSSIGLQVEWYNKLPRFVEYYSGPYRAVIIYDVGNLRTERFKYIREGPNGWRKRQNLTSKSFHQTAFEEGYFFFFTVEGKINLYVQYMKEHVLSLYILRLGEIQRIVENIFHNPHDPEIEKLICKPYEKVCLSGNLTKRIRWDFSSFPFTVINDSVST